MKFIKDIVFSVLINAAILYVLNYYQFWLMIDLKSDFLYGFLALWGILWIINFVLKNIIHIVSLPIRFITFGLFSLVLNVVALYWFEWFVNTYYPTIAEVHMSPDYIKVLILSFVITISYTLLSKILK